MKWETRSVAGGEGRRGKVERRRQEKKGEGLGMLMQGIGAKPDR